MPGEAKRPPLIVLPGALGVSDGGGDALALLRSTREVLVVDYGRGHTFAALEASVFERLELYPGASADLMGFSIGGWFAQCLAARHPDRFRRVVLAHSFVLRRRQAHLFSIAIAVWPLIPRPLFRASVLRRADAALAPLRRRAPDRYAKIRAALKADLSRPEAREALLAQQYVIRDTLREGDCRAGQPVLIVESDDDPLVKAHERERLSLEYPRAGTHVMHDAGHAAALIDPEGFVEQVEAFLDADHRSVASPQRGKARMGAS